jgi:hypothetical protein
MSSHHLTGKKRVSFSETIELFNPPLKRIDSPPSSPHASFQDRMDMAAFSLANMKHSVPVSMDLITATMAAPPSPFQSTGSKKQVSGPLGFFKEVTISALTPPTDSQGDIHFSAAAFSNIARKFYKTARKPHSVTQLVLVDERESDARSSPT